MSQKFFVFTDRDGTETLVQATTRREVDEHFNQGRTIRRAKEADTIRLISSLIVVEPAGAEEGKTEGVDQEAAVQEADATEGTAEQESVGNALSESDPS